MSDYTVSQEERHNRMRNEFMRSLSNLVDFLFMYDGADISAYSNVTLHIDVDDVTDMATKAARLGGKWEKSSDGTYFSLTRKFGDRVNVEMYLAHSAVCTPRVVGTETVEVPDYSVPTPKKTITRDIVEYDCPPSLMRYAGEVKGS